VATKPPIIDSGPLDDIDLEPHDFPIPTETDNTNVLVQISQAISSYPADFIDLEFVDVVIEDGEEVLNTGEEVHFRLHVINRGPLTLRDVNIKLVGKSGAKVRNGSALPTYFPETFARTIATVAGHNSDSPVETELLHLKAPAGVKAAGTDLVEASVDSWNADWQHALNSHSSASTAPNGIFESAVEALND
jgi:hypothetical protein